jgi:hypothetical protein
LTGLAIDLNFAQNVQAGVNGVIQEGHTVDLGLRVLNGAGFVLVKFLCEDIKHGLELVVEVFLLLFEGLVRGDGVDVDFGDLLCDAGVRVEQAGHLVCLYARV